MTYKKYVATLVTTFSLTAVFSFGVGLVVGSCGLLAKAGVPFDFWWYIITQ